MDETIRQWGPWGVVALWFLRELWPWLRDRYSSERRAQIQREQDERRRRDLLEERSVKTQEDISRLLTEMNMRIHHVEQSAQVTAQGVITLLERTAP